MLFFVIALTYYSFKFEHLRAKNIKNAWLLLVAAMFHIWGHILYNERFYTQESDTTACLFVGYIMQHMFGTSLWFYALWSRLILYCSIFQCIGGKTDARLSFKNAIYLISIVTFLFIVVPTIVFIFTVYYNGSIAVDTEDGYCYTEVIWKQVFVAINLCYFLTLALCLCLVPSFIRTSFFDESRAMRDVIIFSGLVFGAEIWLNLKSVPLDLDVNRGFNYLFIAMHMWTLHRIFGYRLWKAIRNDQYYESSFDTKFVSKDTIGQIYSENSTLLNNEQLIRDFYAFCGKEKEKETLVIFSQVSHGKKYFVFVVDIVNFLAQAAQWEDNYKEIGGKKEAFLFYVSIFERYIKEIDGKNTLGIDGAEMERLTLITEDSIAENVFTPITMKMRDLLLRNFFDAYNKSEDILNHFPAEARRRKTVNNLIELNLLKRKDKQKKVNDV